MSQVILIKLKISMLLRSIIVLIQNCTVGPGLQEDDKDDATPPGICIAPHQMKALGACCPSQPGTMLHKAGPDVSPIIVPGIASCELHL